MTKEGAHLPYVFTLGNIHVRPMFLRKISIRRFNVTMENTILSMFIFYVLVCFGRETVWFNLMFVPVTHASFLKVHNIF